MPTPQTNARIEPALLDAARRAMGLPADTPAARVLRAAVLRILGQADADGSDVNRGGRPRRETTKASR